MIPDAYLSLAIGYLLLAVSRWLKANG